MVIVVIAFGVELAPGFGVVVEKLVVADLGQFTRQLLIGFGRVLEDRQQLAAATDHARAVGGFEPAEKTVELLAAFVAVEVGARDHRQEDAGGVDRIGDFGPPGVAGAQLAGVAPHLHIAHQVAQRTAHAVAEVVDPRVLPLVGGAAVADEQVVLELRQVAHVVSPSGQGLMAVTRRRTGTSRALWPLSCAQAPVLKPAGPSAAPCSSRPPSRHIRWRWRVPPCRPGAVRWPGQAARATPATRRGWS